VKVSNTPSAGPHDPIKKPPAAAFVLIPYRQMFGKYSTLFPMMTKVLSLLQFSELWSLLLASAVKKLAINKKQHCPEKIG
jgi:hypothetical protein